MLRSIESDELDSWSRIKDIDGGYQISVNSAGICDQTDLLPDQPFKATLAQDLHPWLYYDRMCGIAGDTCQKR